MAPTSKELAFGEKAFRNLEQYQRYRNPHELLILLVAITTFSVWHGFEQNGWKAALAASLLWFVIGGVSIYQFLNLQKKAREGTVLLKTLKAKYGDSVYETLQKQPHPFFYYVFQKRYFPLKGKPVQLP